MQHTVLTEARWSGAAKTLENWRDNSSITPVGDGRIIPDGGNRPERLAVEKSKVARVASIMLSRTKVVEMSRTQLIE